MGALDGRVVAVTGAGRGIGRAVALACAAEGAMVAVNDLGSEIDGTGHSDEPAMRVATEIVDAGGKAVAVPGDAADEAQAENIIRSALDQFGHIDGLVCASGVRRDRPIWNMTENDWDVAVSRMLRGYFLPAKFATIVMRQQRAGRIVMLTSDAGLGAAGRSGLAAASEGVVGLARTVARDLGRYGVTCNAVSAQADTRLFSASRDAFRANRDAIDPAEVALLPAPDIHAWADAASYWDPGNVAPLVAFLLTDASSAINGQTLGARGGDIYLYSNPAIDRSIHTWNRRLTLDELDHLGPRTLGAGVRHPVTA